jgi:hypothetical protein
MKLKIFPLLFLLLCFAAVGAQVASHAPSVFTQAPAQQPATRPADADSRPVARVNGTVLTRADLVREEDAIFPYARQHGGNIPGELEPQIREGALKMIVFEELVYQETLRLKLTVPPAKIQRAEADFHKQFTTPDQFNTVLAGEFHGSVQLLREKIRRSLLIESYLHSEIDEKSTVSLADIKAYYDNNPVRFQFPETYTFQTISILPPEKATVAQLAEARKRAEDALRQARATKTIEEFGLLAEKTSDDDYRVMMGEHKPVEVDKLAPQVLKALQLMKPGDVSNLIQIEQALTIVRLKEHTLAGKQRFEDVKTQLSKELKQTKTNQLREALDKKLRQNAKIETL